MKNIIINSSNPSRHPTSNAISLQKEELQQSQALMLPVLQKKRKKERQPP